MTRVEDRPPPYAAVLFDCDSTLAAIEGVDELAAGRPDLQRRVAALTERAMGGELPLEAVYGERLAALRPDRAALDALGERYVATALPHGPELMAALHALGKRVHVVSGGLLPAVRRLARHLGVPPARVHAVDVRLDDAGAYLGFDEGSPLARSGGKLELALALGTDGAPCLVGDGASDLEAAPACARFVAFAGVARRESVLEAARVRCERRDLAALAPLLLAPAELDRLRDDPAHAALLAAAALAP